MSFSKPRGFPSFCVFCYKSIPAPGQKGNNPEKIKNFLQFLDRFSKGECAKEKTLIKENHNRRKLQTCEQCDLIIDSFCELYHKMKCLQLQLDLKLDKLIGIIELSSRIPARWVNINEILELIYQDNTRKIPEVKNDIITIRQNVIQAGHRRISNSLPRVLLKAREDNKHNEDNEPRNVKDVFLDDPMNLNTSCSVVEALNTTENGPLEQIELKVDPIPISEEDTNFPISASEIASASMLDDNQALNQTGNEFEEYDTFVKTEDCSTLFLQDTFCSEFVKNEDMESGNLIPINTSSAVVLNGRLHKTEKPYSDPSTSKSRKPYRIAIGHKLVKKKPAGRKYKGSRLPKRECPECFKMISIPGFTAHQRLHTGEFPHICEYCNRGFAQIGVLQRHRANKHTGETKFNCEVCEKGFFLKYYLNRHRKNVHNALERV